MFVKGRIKSEIMTNTYEMLLLCQTLHQTFCPHSPPSAPQMLLCAGNTWGAGREDLARRQILTQSQGVEELALLSRFQIRTIPLNPNAHASLTTPYEADTLTLFHMIHSRRAH